MKAESSFKTLVIPAGLSIPVNITGSSFYLEAGTGLVYVQFDEGGEIACKSGQTVDLPPGDIFRKIIFRNPDTNASITLQYYAGTLAVGTRTPYVYMRPAPTYSVSSAFTAANGVPTSIPATNLRTGKTVADSRAYVLVQNTDVAGTIAVMNNGIKLYPLMQPTRIDTTEGLTVAGSGAAVLCCYVNYFNYDS